MFKKCWETYENADFTVFNSTVKKYGEDAYVKYKKIVKKHLKYRGFDDIEYGV